MQKVYDQIILSFHLDTYCFRLFFTPFSFLGFFLQLSLSVLFTITNKFYLALVFTFLLSQIYLTFLFYTVFFYLFFLFALHYFESLFPQLLRYVSSLSIFFSIFIYGFSFHYFDDFVDHIFISQSFTISIFFILFPLLSSLFLFSFIYPLVSPPPQLLLINYYLFHLSFILI